MSISSWRKVNKVGSFLGELRERYIGSNICITCRATLVIALSIHICAIRYTNIHFISARFRELIRRANGSESLNGAVFTSGPRVYKRHVYYYSRCKCIVMRSTPSCAGTLRGGEVHDLHRVKCNLVEIDELSLNDRHFKSHVAENAEMDVISA